MIIIVLLICTIIFIYYLNKNAWAEKKSRDFYYTGDSRDTYFHNGQERLCINRRPIFRLEYNGELYVWDLKSEKPLFSADQYNFDRFYRQMVSYAKSNNIRFVTFKGKDARYVGLPVDKFTKCSLYYDTKANEYYYNIRITYKCTDDYIWYDTIIINCKTLRILNSEYADEKFYNYNSTSKLQFCSDDKLIQQFQQRIINMEKEKGTKETLLWLTRKRSEFSIVTASIYKDFDFTDIIDPRPITLIIKIESEYSNAFKWAIKQATEDEIQQVIDETEPLFRNIMIKKIEKERG